MKRRMPSRRIAGSSRGEERKKNDPPTVDLQDHALRRLLLQTENQEKKAPKAGAQRSVTAWKKKLRLSFSPTTATNLS